MLRDEQCVKIEWDKITNENNPVFNNASYKLQTSLIFENIK